MVLLDTDVLSFTAPTSRLNGTTAELWRKRVKAEAQDYHLSAMTVFEISAGVRKAELGGALQEARMLGAWRNYLLDVFADRIVAIDADIASCAGALLANARKAGFDPSEADTLIGATAQVRGWILYTRNGRDYDALGVKWSNPLS